MPATNILTRYLIVCGARARWFMPMVMREVRDGSSITLRFVQSRVQLQQPEFQITRASRTDS